MRNHIVLPLLLALLVPALALANTTRLEASDAERFTAHIDTTFAHPDTDYILTVTDSFTVHGSRTVGPNCTLVVLPGVTLNLTDTLYRLGTVDIRKGATLLTETNPGSSTINLAAPDAASFRAHLAEMIPERDYWLTVTGSYPVDGDVAIPSNCYLYIAAGESLTLPGALASGGHIQIEAQASLHIGTFLTGHHHVSNHGTLTIDTLPDFGNTRFTGTGEFHLPDGSYSALRLDYAGGSYHDIRPGQLDTRIYRHGCEYGFNIGSHIPTRDGYAFLHWLTPDGDIPLPAADGYYYPPDGEDTTLTAVWEPLPS